MAVYWLYGRLPSLGLQSLVRLSLSESALDVYILCTVSSNIFRDAATDPDGFRSQIFARCKSVQSFVAYPNSPFIVTLSLYEPSWRQDKAWLNDSHAAIVLLKWSREIIEDL